MHPTFEPQRLAALVQYAILDTAPEAAFERITSLAAQMFGVPIARISLVDEDRIWFKSFHGTSGATTSRDHATCAHAILTDQVTMVTDAAADPRFRDHPLVKSEPDARFYAGAPLHTATGFNLGILCLVDNLRLRQCGADQLHENAEDLRVVVGDDHARANGRRGSLHR